VKCENNPKDDIMSSNTKLIRKSFLRVGLFLIVLFSNVTYSFAKKNNVNYALKGGVDIKDPVYQNTRRFVKLIDDGKLRLSNSL